MSTNPKEPQPLSLDLQVAAALAEYEDATDEVGSTFELPTTELFITRMLPFLRTLFLRRLLDSSYATHKVHDAWNVFFVSAKAIRTRIGRANYKHFITDVFDPVGVNDKGFHTYSKKNRSCRAWMPKEGVMRAVLSSSSRDSIPIQQPTDTTVCEVVNLSALNEYLEGDKCGSDWALMVALDHLSSQIHHTDIEGKFGYLYVDYKRVYMTGRRFAVDVSVQNLPKTVVADLLRGTDVHEFDIVNSMPSIIDQQTDGKYTTLHRYVTDRESVLDELSTTLGVTRAASKRLVLLAISGAVVNPKSARASDSAFHEWIEDYVTDPFSLRFLRSTSLVFLASLQAEMAQLRGAYVEANPDSLERARAHSEGAPYVPDWRLVLSAFTLDYQAVEDSILSVAESFFESRGYIIRGLKFDALLVDTLGSSPDVSSLAAELSAAVFTTTGYNLTFSTTSF